MFEMYLTHSGAPLLVDDVDPSDMRKVANEEGGRYRGVIGKAGLVDEDTSTARMSS